MAAMAAPLQEAPQPRRTSGGRREGWNAVYRPKNDRETHAMVKMAAEISRERKIRQRDLAAGKMAAAMRSPPKWDLAAVNSNGRKEWARCHTARKETEAAQGGEEMPAKSREEDWAEMAESPDKAQEGREPRGSTLRWVKEIRHQ